MSPEPEKEQPQTKKRQSNPASNNSVAFLKLTIYSTSERSIFNFEQKA
jgi:hypothetical protein